MLIASGVEFGDACMAALGQQPQLIGYIQSATGCSTLWRANGTAVQAVAGLLVCEGDVVDTAADGRLAIHFIDGTVLNLSGDTRAQLNEYVSDSLCAPQSALFVIPRGIFALTGGALARSGLLTVDTPVGRIRSRAAAGGFGMLSLTALVFSLLQEARAADPDVTILDDDRITYKDLHHGVFELVTKEAVPRHIIVEDPGETVVITKRGSSVSVSQVANSPARMEELRAIQQAALGNYEKGWEAKGSGTTPFDRSQLLQPINFDPADPTIAQNPLAALPQFIIPENQLIPPRPPVLDLGAGPTEVDTIAFDAFATVSGAFSASTSNGGALIFGIGGGVLDHEWVGKREYDVSAVGTYGKFFLNSKTGAYTFVPNNDAINALKANTTQTFVITVSDSKLSSSQVFSIPIVGTDDASIISGTIAGAVVGAVGVAEASPGLLIASGTLTDIDVDDPANTFTAISTPKKSAGGYGTFTMTIGGTWTYTLDNANSAVQALRVGDTLTDSFTVTTIGGTPQLITVTIHGPLLGVAGPGPLTPLSETHLTATALNDNVAGSAPDGALTKIAADFSTAFTSVQGTDGATISYALTITGGNGVASGLVDSHTGLADVLVLNGNTIEGLVAGGTLAFTITVDPATGIITFTEYRAVQQPFGTSPDNGEGVSLTSGLVNLVATVTDINGEFQRASIDLGRQLLITDDGPSIAPTGTAPSLTLSETHLTATGLDDNIAGSAPDVVLTAISADFATAFTSVQGADGATINYALTIAGGDGTASGLVDSHTGLADVLVLNGNVIEGRVGDTGGTLAFIITLDPATGLVTFISYRPVMQPNGTSPDGGEGVSLTSGLVNLVATITDLDGDVQAASLDLGSRLTITDDGPNIATTGTAPSLILSEAALAGAAQTATSGDFSTAFTSVQGADGATIGYALAIAGGSGTASGLVDSQTGLADVLVQSGNTIEGHVGGIGGTLAFTIALDPVTGLVTFTAYRAVKQPAGSDDKSLTSGIVSLVATITDNDGDFRAASIDLASRLIITDAGPTIGTTGTAPLLTLSETHLTATERNDGIAGSAPNAALTVTSASFASAFTSTQDADSATIGYALAIAGGNGTPSGLVDSHTGLADVLVLNGNTIEGHVGGIEGMLAFTIAVNPVTGLVTFTEFRAVKQSSATNPDSGEGIALTPNIVSLVATITDTDGDFRTASIDLGSRLIISDDGPAIGTTGTAPSLTLSETHLTATALNDNIAGSAPNAALTSTSGNFATAFTSVQGADGATISYALAITGGNGAASGLIDSHTGLADVLVLNGNTIEGHVGSAAGVLAFTIALNAATGLVTFTEYRAVKQALGTNPDSGEGRSLTAGIVSLVATITDKDGDFQKASIDLASRLTITDDGPAVAATGTAPSLTLSETHLTATAQNDNIGGSAPNATLTAVSADFASAFTSSQGADGATIGYALTITGGNGTASGLVDSHTGLADVLVLNGSTIEGRVGSTGGALAFTIALNPVTGLVTFTEYRAVKQPLGTNPDTGEGKSPTSGIVSLVATITDKDGDFQKASIDLGSRLTITDDGPTIAATGTAPSLTLSETHLTATVGDDNIGGTAPNAALTAISASFASAFTSSQGADSATIGYSLKITGGNGTASGLVDSHTGLADVLVLNGNTIEGHVGSAGGKLAFTIAVNPTSGLVTFTEYRAVKQALGTNPDGGEGKSLASGIVSLDATITDKDGDFQIACIDLGKQLTITDDGPTIGGFDHAVLPAENDQIANGTYDVNFGADGNAGMLLAIHNGAVGSTGFNLATSNLGNGITSVHVTGNEADYNFYYTTHAVSGGVELDAYLTNANGALTDPYFTLLINPNGTYSFNLESVEILKEVTVAGSDFGASGSGTPSLTSPDEQLIITGSDNNGVPIDVKASSNGIAVGNTGLQMDSNERLNIAFVQEQPHVSFILTQWQGNGTANVVFHILDGSTDIHDFSVDIPKPSGGIANVVVQETSDTSLINTQTFDGSTKTYTLYVGHEFDQIQVGYDHAASGNATFTVNDITYNQETTIPSTDLLFDVSAFDKDGDSAATSLQVDIQGGTSHSASLASPALETSAVAAAGMAAAPSADTFHFTEQTFSSVAPEAPAPAALDLGPAWSGHHEDAVAAFSPPAVTDTAPAIDPGSYFKLAVDHLPHDLIL